MMYPILEWIVGVVFSLALLAFAAFLWIFVWAFATGRVH